MNSSAADTYLEFVVFTKKDAVSAEVRRLRTVHQAYIFLTEQGTSSAAH